MKTCRAAITCALALIATALSASAQAAAGGAAAVSVSSLGPSGDKYVDKTPALPPPLGTPQSVSAHPAGGGSGYVGGGPALQADCPEYGGAFDLLARGAGYDVMPGPQQVVMTFRRPVITDSADRPTVYRVRGTEYKAVDLKQELAIRIGIVGMSRLAQVGEVSPTFGRRHYFGTGGDPMQLIQDLPTFATLRYTDILPGVDYLLFAGQGELEHVFIAWPGADISRLRLEYDATHPFRVDNFGNMAIDMECGEIIQRAPIFYRLESGRATTEAGRYAVEGNTVSFALDPETEADRDARRKSRRPALEHLGYLGGSGVDRAYAMAVDGAGYGYVVGETSSGNLPLANKRARGGGRGDVFVTKYRIADSTVIYSTILGGRADDRAFAVAPDGEGNVYVCGETVSADFPGGRQGEAGPAGRSWDAFVVKLNASGEMVPGSGRIGGSGDDRAYGIALDGRGGVYVAGETASRDFPVRRSRLAGPSGGRDGFLVQLSATNLAIDSSSYIGGSGDDAVLAMALDGAGCVYVAGQTTSTNLPEIASLQGRPGGAPWNGFVMKLGARDGGPVYASYVGGTNDDRVYGLCVDAGGNAFVCGETASADFPATNAAQARYGGGEWDGFVAKIAAAGGRYIFASYLGGESLDRAMSVAVDADGHAHVAGTTASTNLLVVDPVQKTIGGVGRDGFVSKLDPDGLTLIYQTYLGGAGDDALTSIWVDGQRRAHVAGTTVAPSLPVVYPVQSAFQGGASDAILATIRPERPPGPPLRLVSGNGQPGGPEYDFYVSQYEISNGEFVRFLNDAQANTNSLRGTNLFFDAAGNVWFNPAMQTNRHEVFQMGNSRLIYRPDYAVGSRYAVTATNPPDGGSYYNHPAVGVSWFGAIKFCNWLTIDSGRGGAERCYWEGTNEWDWCPVGVSPTNWVRGYFGTAERYRWLELKGFRLPMDNCWGTNSWPNPFNEFLKAGSWGGETNAPYGYGRDVVVPGDANYRDTNGLRQFDTTPVGFFNGSNYVGRIQTRTNENAYGIYDLSGNVSEWLNDPGDTNIPRSRAFYGGGWDEALPPLTERSYREPCAAPDYGGFRVVSTVSDDVMYVIRIPYRICLCGVSENAPGVKKGAAEQTGAGTGTGQPGSTGPSPSTTQGGVLYKTTPTTQGPTPTTQPPGEEGGGGGGGGPPGRPPPPEETTTTTVPGTTTTTTITTTTTTSTSQPGTTTTTTTTSTTVTTQPPISRSGL